MDMEEACLARMDSSSRRGGGRCALRHLRGQRVLVGFYTGFTQDGGVAVPWNWELPSS
jgi:hypothetical protein